MYQPNTICPGPLYLVLWYVDSNVKASATRITIHGSASSKYFPCRLYVCTRLPSTSFILSMIEFACGLPWETGLVLIKYEFLSSYF